MERDTVHSENIGALFIQAVSKRRRDRRAVENTILSVPIIVGVCVCVCVCVCEWMQLSTKYEVRYIFYQIPTVCYRICISLNTCKTECNIENTE